MEDFFKKFDLKSFQKPSPSDLPTPQEQTTSPEPTKPILPSHNTPPKELSPPPAAELSPDENPDNTLTLVVSSIQKDAKATTEQVLAASTPEKQAAASLLSIPGVSPAAQSSEVPTSQSSLRYSGRKKIGVSKKGSKKK